MHVLISAGEASGDTHAAEVIRSILRLYPKADIYGIAGANMQAAGCNPLVPMQTLNVMGIGEVIRAMPRIRSARDTVLNWAKSNHPHVAILVDYPGFHMRLGKRLRDLDIPVLQYIAPKLWAWGARRITRLKQSQDRLACILPFEPGWFREHGITADYVGNPSTLVCSGGWSAQELRRRLDLSEDTRLLALLPGSRPAELDHHVPLLAEVWRQIKQTMSDVHCVVPRAPDVDEGKLSPLTEAGAKLIDRMSEGYALRADAAVAVSGTATLELALWDVPTVLVYRSSPLMIYMARKFVHLQCAGLVNILLGDKPIMPELIQEQATVGNIVANVLPLLQAGKAAREQREQFSKLRALLGEMNPADQIAKMALDMAQP